ncbi:MAG: iron-sulfur cluster insertion protein ErpA [Proteobacteria bacterium]|nr:iron-sulfur cluster insertion protein ErpA [Pseudomonadota bacterium]
MVRIAFEDTPAPAASDILSVRVTTAAAKRVAKLLKDEGRDDLFLRVTVNGGGCNGYSYNFKFDTVQNPDDIAITQDGITVLIDMMSFNYLKGSTIDYVETLEAAQFVINNPNATSSCGCGNSFSL